MELEGDKMKWQRCVFQSKSVSRSRLSCPRQSSLCFVIWMTWLGTVGGEVCYWSLETRHEGECREGWVCRLVYDLPRKPAWIQSSWIWRRRTRSSVLRTALELEWVRRYGCGSEGCWLWMCRGCVHELDTVGGEGQDSWTDIKKRLFQRSPEIFWRVSFSSGAISIESISKAHNCEALH